MSQSKECLLWEAATRDDLETVISLTADESVDVNWGDEVDKRTPFYRACGHGCARVVLHLLKDLRVDPNQPQKEGGTPLYIACQEGHAEVVSLLLADPRIDPNSFQTVAGFSPLFMACENGHCAVVSLLMADGRIDIMKPTKSSGATPFYIACQEGNLPIVSLLLTDPRIGVNVPRDDNSSPLWFACQNGHLDVVQILLASGLEVDTQTRSKFNNNTAAEQALIAPLYPMGSKCTEATFQRRKVNCPKIAELLKLYDRDPDRVRGELRRLPAIRDRFVGYVYAMVVFFSDSYVTVKPTAPAATQRFFKIMGSLPLDLQMFVSNRMFGSAVDIVKMADSEVGFRWVLQSPPC